MKKLYNLFYIFLLSLVFSSTAHAVSLQSLFSGGSLTVGKLLFDQWSLVNLVSTDPAQDPDPNLIDVQGLSSDPHNSGLRFTTSDELTAINNSFIDFYFSFRVSSLGGQIIIKDNELAITDASIVRADAQGDPIVAILETVEDVVGNELAQKYVELSYTSLNLVDSANFPSQDSIWVTKNVLVAGLNPGDIASLKGFEQHFSVPEPVTLMLFGFGFLLLARPKLAANK